MPYQSSKARIRLLWAVWALAGLALVLGGVAWRLARQQENNEHQQTFLQGQSARLAALLEGRLIQMQAEADLMAATLQAQPRGGFPALMRHAALPGYLYRDTVPVFWSVSEMVPGGRAVAGPRWALERSRRGSALVHRKRFTALADTFTALIREPLYVRYPVTNGYLRAHWEGADLTGALLLPDSTLPQAVWVRTPEGGRLCAVVVPAGSELAQAIGQRRILLASAGALLAALLALACSVRWLALGKRYGQALALWGAGLVALRLALWSPAVRDGLNGLPLFSPRLYASSALAPSLGDLLLSALLGVAGLWVLFRYVFKTGWQAYVWAAPAWAGRAPGVRRAWQGIWAGLLTVGFAGGVLAAYRVMRSLYTHSQTVLDVARGLRFSWERALALTIFIAISFGLFFWLHLLARLATRLFAERRRSFLTGWAAALVLVLGVLALAGSRAIFLEAFALALLPVLAWLKLPEYLFRLRYQTYFYLFSMAILAAATGLAGYARFRDRHGFLERQKYARRLVAQADPLGEYLLSDAQQRLATDTALARLIADYDADPEALVERVRSLYSDAYFDQFRLEIGVFWPGGALRAGQAEIPNYMRLSRFVRSNMARTEYGELFYSHMPSDEVFRRYVGLVELHALADSGAADSLSLPARRGPGPLLGYIGLDLKLRRLPEASVFPTLLLDGPGTAAGGTPGTGLSQERYSFAVYDSAGVRQQDGPYNYERAFDPAWLTGMRGPINTLSQAGWEHTLFRQADGQTVVVSAVDTRLRDSFANFSFLLLVLVAFVLVFVIVFTLHQQSGDRRLTFAGKIQIYLNAAFFLPLTVFGLVSFTLVEISLRADLQQGYVSRARQAAKSLEPILDQAQARKLSPQELSRRLDDLARYTGLDVSLFSPRGKLVYSSQPLVYARGLLSPYINPEALTELADEGLHEALLPERIGRLSYASAYVAVRSAEREDLQGIIAVPFFDAGTELETQLANALATVVNAFTAVFIVFMVLSYFASQVLVVPLKLITQRLKRTTLGDVEPLVWAARDEIGLLTDAYNRMLVKLDASRQALAESEKESAWREMAQQVAHEIKNPLTPMRLQVQMLQRTMAAGPGPNQDPTEYSRLERTLVSLLEQIENLSDIAGSFSAFARMPAPVQERFDLAALLRRAVALHPLAIVHYQGPSQDVYVVADLGIFQGIFTNLILNGLQAVPHSRLACLEVSLSTDVPAGQVVLRFADNGTGIPADIRKKVFLPNFSTKFTGSGIGLALARRGVEHAGGRIWFETEEDVGTVFYIALPMAG